MILLRRLPEPDILREKKKQWLAKFLKKRKETPGHRPHSRQYGHPRIRETLWAMSFGKCFYCERKLGEAKGEVEHYIEVANDPQQAFTWENLYLSCTVCNSRKSDHTAIPVSDCLNPCDASENPADHLSFDDEQIRSYQDSPRGQKTIQKYKLDRAELDYLRVKQLQQFNQLLLQIRERQLSENGRPLTKSEREALARFKSREHAFSLMFSVYLTKLNL